MLHGSKGGKGTGGFSGEEPSEPDQVDYPVAAVAMHAMTTAVIWTWSNLQLDWIWQKSQKVNNMRPYQGFNAKQSADCSVCKDKGLLRTLCFQLLALPWNNARQVNEMLKGIRSERRQCCANVGRLPSSFTKWYLIWRHQSFLHLGQLLLSFDRTSLTITRRRLSSAL